MSLPNNIILTGFMGAGKTSTGKELARILNYHFWDMDQWIEEKNGKNVSEIFSKNGEKYFRSQEMESINWLKEKVSYVVSTGGGSWINQENRDKLLKMGWCVWLKVSPEKVLERIGAHLSQRPILAKSKNPLNEINEILSTRNPIYALAHTSFNTNEKKPREIALEIFKAFKEDRPFDLRSLQK
jgi:shikimate kinase